jgi:hypothetical protein
MKMKSQENGRNQLICELRGRFQTIHLSKPTQIIFRNLRQGLLHLLINRPFFRIYLLLEIYAIEPK